MARSKSDISNTAIRIFLQKVGKFYDEARGYDRFSPTKSQKDELLNHFNGQCAYCGTELIKSLSQDHLIPMNKTHLGLHAWGNVIPVCTDCNNQRQQKPWIEFLKEKSPIKYYSSRKKRIESFVKLKKYDPNINLNDIASNLYDDIGEVAMTLIGLRYDQAERKIRSLLD